MSGPKDYSPPPRYSMHVFEGKLNHVFQLQSCLKILCTEIANLHLSDSDLNIQFDCNNELSKIKKQIDRVQKALVFDYKGTFGQDAYNRIKGEVNLRVSELLKMVNECEMIKSDFESKKSDYNSFVSYNGFYDNSNLSFDEFKEKIIHYLRINIESDSPEIFNEAYKKISDVKFITSRAKFSFGFNSKIDSEKQTIIDHLIQKEESVNYIRAEISDKIIEKFSDGSSQIQLIQKKDNKVSDESKTILENIKSLIRNCDDLTMRNKYKFEFEKLTKSETLKDIYFFKELHDSIFEREKTRTIKIKINQELSFLNTFVFHSSTQPERQNLIKLCLNLLNSSSINKNQFDEIQLKQNQLKNQSNKYFEEDEIKIKERLFLKSQLILCLENQGYEIMDDLQVIDFEKENDFLLKINGQENYLNLKFKEDGSMRYIFQIPEKKDKLSTDQKNLKLHEMKVSCSEFQSVLKDLSKMGLNVNMRSEKPIELDSIISITKNENAKLKERNKTQQRKQQLRIKYLS